jgi:hypothetical protein
LIEAAALLALFGGDPVAGLEACATPGGMTEEVLRRLRSPAAARPEH